MSLGTLETQQDWNELLACCCPMPLCPVIVPICTSIFGFLRSGGYRNDDDTEWTIYKKQGWTTAWHDSDVINFTGLTPGTPSAAYNGTPSTEYEVGYDAFDGYTWDLLYDGGIGYGDGCPIYSPTQENECTAEGFATQKNYAIFGYSTGEFPDIVHHAVKGLSFESRAEVSDVGGEETDEHIAWDAEFGAAVADWDAAHPSGPSWQDAKSTHGTWQAARTALDDWTACELETPGECGDEPADPGAEPELPAIDDEPTENYAPCTFRITTTSTWTPFRFGGYPSVPDSEDPTDGEAFAAWVAAGASGDPPAPGTNVRKEYSDITSLYAALGYGGNADELSIEYGLTEPYSYAAWMALAQGVIDSEMTLPNDDCAGTECTALLEKSPEPETNEGDITINSRRAEVKFQIPATWRDQFTGLIVPFTGTVYQITYDILDTPEGWNATIDDPDYEPPAEEPEGGWPPIPQIPKPGRPSRSFVLEDQTLEWTGPGSGEQSDPSWLTEAITLDPPADKVVRSVVNIRFICQPDSPWGTLPQVTGAAVTLPDP